MRLRCSFARAGTRLLLQRDMSKDIRKMTAPPAPAVTECLHALCSFTKVGTMVFLLHDINDGFLESAKMANYADKLFLGNCLFVLFIISWVATRLTYFPLWVIRSCLSEPLEVTLAHTLPPIWPACCSDRASWFFQSFKVSLVEVSHPCSPHILEGTKACYWHVLQQPDDACVAPPKKVCHGILDCGCRPAAWLRAAALCMPAATCIFPPIM